MTTSTYATDLTDRQWQLIKDLLPAPKKRGRPRTLCLRSTFNAMLYLLTTGCPWRQLPHCYPHWKSVYRYFALWRDSGLWMCLHERLRAWVRRSQGRRKRPTAGCLDSQSVKGTHVRGCRGFDGAKILVGRKRHLVVDTQGLLLAVHVSPANLSDTAGGRQVLMRLPQAASKLRHLWVDAGYKPAVRQWAQENLGLHLEVVQRPSDQRGFQLLPRRWVVERTFAWLFSCRRLCRDYETSTYSSEALIYLAMCRIMIRRLQPV